MIAGHGGGRPAGPGGAGLVPLAGGQVARRVGRRSRAVVVLHAPEGGARVHRATRVATTRSDGVVAPEPAPAARARTDPGGHVRVTPVLVGSTAVGPTPVAPVPVAPVVVVSAPVAPVAVARTPAVLVVVAPTLAGLMPAGPTAARVAVHGRHGRPTRVGRRPARVGAGRTRRVGRAAARHLGRRVVALHVTALGVVAPRAVTPCAVTPCAVAVHAAAPCAVGSGQKAPVGGSGPTARVADRPRRATTAHVGGPAGRDLRRRAVPTAPGGGVPHPRAATAVRVLGGPGAARRRQAGTSVRTARAGPTVPVGTRRSLRAPVPASGHVGTPHHAAVRNHAMNTGRRRSGGAATRRVPSAGSGGPSATVRRRAVRRAPMRAVPAVRAPRAARTTAVALVARTGRAAPAGPGRHAAGAALVARPPLAVLGAMRPRGGRRAPTARRARTGRRTRTFPTTSTTASSTARCGPGCAR
jgi:hypothetical protein